MSTSPLKQKRPSLSPTKWKPQCVWKISLVPGQVLTLWSHAPYTLGSSDKRQIMTSSLQKNATNPPLKKVIECRWLRSFFLIWRRGPGWKLSLLPPHLIMGKDENGKKSFLFFVFLVVVLLLIRHINVIGWGEGVKNLEIKMERNSGVINRKVIVTSKIYIF